LENEEDPEGLPVAVPDEQDLPAVEESPNQEVAASVFVPLHVTVS
jgi:hypothetical protein